MKLDFNFEIFGWSGKKINDASKMMILVLEAGSNQDEKTIGKTNIWGKSITKDGTAEMDHIDAEQLKQMVIVSQAIIDPVKEPLIKYIQKRIEATKKE